MTAKIKNIIIFTVIAALLILIYIFFIKPAPVQQNLVSSSVGTTLPDTNSSDQNPPLSNDFLSLLLSVKSIKLNDTIFSDNAFLNLKDSSILLIPAGNEGRLNPFAPIGFDTVATPPAQPEKTIPPTN